MSSSASPALCLVGTSNAVYRDGYAKALRESPAFSGFASFSLGTSCSALFAYRLAELDLSCFNLCLLDFTCNDTALHADGALDLPAIESQLESAIAEITVQGCLPALLILPSLKALPDGGAVARAYRLVALRCRVPFFDGYAFLAAMAGQGLTPQDQFQDDMHLHPAIACQIGTILAGALRDIWQHRRPAGETELTSARYRCARAAELAGGHLPLQPVSTSLLRAETLLLAGDAEIRLPMAEDEDVTAVAFNFTSSRGVLALEGETSARLRLTSEHTHGPHIVCGVLPVRPVAPGGAGALRLHLAPDAATAPPMAALLGLILRRPARLRIPFFYHQAPDLLTFAAPAFTALAPALQALLPGHLVRAAYLALLHRPPDPDGQKTAQALLTQHGLTGGLQKLLARMLTSPEFHQRQS